MSIGGVRRATPNVITVARMHDTLKALAVLRDRKLDARTEEEHAAVIILLDKVLDTYLDLGGGHG